MCLSVKVAHLEMSVIVDPVTQGFKVNKISMHPQEAVETSHLMGALFRDGRQVRLACESAMRAYLGIGDSVSGDLLDNVLLSQNAINQWQAEVDRAIANGLCEGCRPDEMGDEKARLLGDGQLEIFIELPNGLRLATTISAADWASRISIQ